MVRDVDLGENAVEGKWGLLPNQSKLSGWTSGLLQQIMHIDEKEIKKGIIFYSFLKAVMDNQNTCSTSYINLQRNETVKGVFEMGNYHIQLNEKRGDDGNIDHYEFIIVDNSDSEKRKMAVLTAESVDSELGEMDCSGMRENVIIDLNEEGRRWEGGELNGKPFGFGREYSEDGNLVYEGFVYEGMKVCVGKEWNDDGNNNCLMYEGGYCNDERWGKGKSCDLDGNVDFEGEWVNNHGMSENKKDLMNELIVPMSIEELVIYDEVFNAENITTLHFSPSLIRLKRIGVGDHCFKHVREFVIDGLKSMESVKIGDNCFRIGGWRERDDGICRITNCPNLHQLEIGWHSFADFKSFELSNVNSLQSIKFGECCFWYADFSLKGE